MKTANLFTYCACTAIALFVAFVTQSMLHAEILYYPYYGGTIEPIPGEPELTAWVNFWGPKVHAAMVFLRLALPAIAGIAVLIFAEKKMFAKQADKHLSVIVPLGTVTAVGMTYLATTVGVPQMTDWVFASCAIGLTAFYAFSYQYYRTGRTNAKETAR